MPQSLNLSCCRRLKESSHTLRGLGFCLQYDNASSHSSRIVMDTVNKLGIELLPHPPYSPDLAICDFRLFPNFKNRLRGNKYESREELRCAVNKTLAGDVT